MYFVGNNNNKKKKTSILIINLYIMLTKESDIFLALINKSKHIRITFKMFFGIYLLNIILLHL